MRKTLLSLLMLGLTAYPTTMMNARETQGVQEFTIFEEEIFKPSVDQNKLISFTHFQNNFLLRFDTKGNGKDNVVLSYELKDLNSEGFHVKGPTWIGIDRDGNQFYDASEIKPYFPQTEEDYG